MKFKVKLRLIDSSGKKHKYSLNLEEGSKFTVGRGTPGIGAELNHATVSTAHCHLTISGGVLHVMDNKSRNGTKLNGKPVTNAAVRVGDMVQLGVCQIEFLEAPNPPIEENPQSTTFIDINELSPEEAALLGKGRIAEQLGTPEPTMAMSKQALSQALAESEAPTDEAPDDAMPVAVSGQNEEPSRVIDPAAQTPPSAGDTGAYGGPPNPYAAPPNPYAAPANPYGSPANSYGAPPVPDRPGAEPRSEDTLGFRPLDSYGRGREGEYRREDDPRYNPDARGRGRRDRNEEEDSRSSSRKSKRREFTDTGASVKSRKASRERSGGVDTNALVSTIITLVGTAAAGSLVSYQKGTYFPLVTFVAGIVGTALVAFLAWVLRKQNEFMEAEGEAKDYYRFLAYSTVALVPASLLTSSAIIFRLAAFIVLGVAFFHFFMVKFRPVAEKFVFLVGSYVCVVTFLGYMVGGQISGGQVGPQPKNQKITKNEKPQNDDDQDREPADDDSDDQETPEQPEAPQQPPPEPPQPQKTEAPQAQQTAQPQPPPQPPQQTPQAQNTPPPQPQKIETPPDKPKNNKPGPDSFAISQLYKAAEHGDVDIVRKLIHEKGVNPNTVAENGVTALMLAAYYGHGETAKFLLGESADINLKDRQGTTALMWAVLKGNRDMVLLLVKAGANLTARRNDGDTALDIARLWHYDEVVRILEDPERAKKGLASGGGGGSRKPGSTKKTPPKKAPGKAKPKPAAKKKAKYSAKVDDDS